MLLKYIIRELTGARKGVENKSKEQDQSKCDLSHFVPESVSVQQAQRANLPPELLFDIIKRIDEGETAWPARRALVACAAVCRSWREITREIIRTPEQCGLLTFPMSLKQPGPRDNPLQCFIKRERATSTYRLYLGLTPALSGDASKLLLAAKKIKRATRTEFIISMAANDFSQTSHNYVGRLRSNFFGSKFVIHDSQPPCNSAIRSPGWSCKRISTKKVSPRPPVCNYKVATISYELNVLRTRGPRRMQCVMHTVPVSAIEEGGQAPTPATFNNSLDEMFRPWTPQNEQNRESTSSSVVKTSGDCCDTGDPLLLKNKSPRWHEQLQCWCLNFRGRVTVASVKNFQLVAAVGPSHNVSDSEQERVILQFGKIGKDIFTMDYQYPLSAFQAFAICLSSFDTKPACE